MHVQCHNAANESFVLHTTSMLVIRVYLLRITYIRSNRCNKMKLMDKVVTNILFTLKHPFSNYTLFVFIIVKPLLPMLALITFLSSF